MSDEDYEYMKRCLWKGVADTNQQQDAADRIEELEANLAKLEAAAQKAVGHITGYGEASTARIELRTTLAELTGGKDE